jgi:two-component system CheB/CheR fusion protein
VQVVEREVRDRDGRWYTLRVAPYRTHDNRIEGAVVLLIDVDQLRRGKQDLEDQAVLMRQQSALIEMSHDAVIVRDAVDKILFWNRGAQEVYGWSVQEAQGRMLPELLRADPRAWARITETLERTGSSEGELRLTRKDGAEILVHSRAVFTRGSEDTPRTALSIQRDVTESRRTMVALRHADRQKDQFLATLAHELRNPIAPIRNAVEIMRLAGNDPETIRSLREMLDRQVRQLAGIVEDLIDVSRIIERRIDLRLQRVPIAPIVKTAVDSVRDLMASCEHRLTIQLPAEPVLLDLDEVRISQVLVNLLNNAAKFTPAGGRIELVVEKEAGAREDPGELLIRLRDSGVGISRDSQDRVFDMFEQGTSIQQHGAPGLGIGLTLVKSLLTMHGGTIEVHSEGAGQGTEFVVRLPIADPSSPAPAPITGAAGATRPRAFGNTKLRVLVVDDNRDQAASLAKVLALTGHDVQLAYDGEQALEVAARFLPEIALVDIGLPKLNGYEVAARLRKDPRHQGLVLVAQTGWGQEQDRQRSKAAGFDHHVVKPVGAEDLQAIFAAAPRNS